MRTNASWALLMLALGCSSEHTSEVSAADQASLVGEPDPVINKPVFNDPIGSKAAQNANFIQLARLIDRVPDGEEINTSFFGFDPPDTDDAADNPDLVDRLLRAYARGVRIKMVLDEQNNGKPVFNRLAKVLGTDDTKPSYVVTCDDQFKNGPKRGCIGTRNVVWSPTSTTWSYNHNKFALFSKVKLTTGVVSNVVLQGSSNIGTWDAIEAYNTMHTWSDPGTYEAFKKYFADLTRFRHTAEGNNNYYWSTPSGTEYRAYFFPRKETAGEPEQTTDTIYNILDSIKSCSYDDNGVRRQTDVRIAMLVINRWQIARKLTALKRAGCWVDIVFTDMSEKSRQELAVADGPQLTKCNFNMGPGIDVRVHSKYLLIDGAYDDDTTPRVFSGSHNYAYSALRQADETLVRFMGRSTHDEYVRNFWHLRDTCRARGGAVR